MQYAPVIIPTLNRFEHFKRCLESLERCTGSDNTVVYVALDFPPSEQYVVGWKKIDEYLKGKEQCNEFKELKVIRRKHNYFFSGISVYSGIVEEATLNINCYILSEDDNVFSPCFLDFMNKALEKYSDNPKVYSVCGYNNPKYELIGKDVIFLFDNSAWGIGRWTNKGKSNIKYITTKLHSFSCVIKLWKTFPALLNELLVMLEKGRVYGDVINSTICILDDKYQIRPSVSLVRNMGDDGSGQHTGKSGIFSSQKISFNEIFEFKDYIIERTKELDKCVYFNMMSVSLYGRIKTHFSILVKLIKFHIKHEKSAE